MPEESRRKSVAVLVTARERDVVRALAFIEGKSISDVLYPWVKPYLDAAGERPDVRTIIAQKERVAAGES